MFISLIPPKKYRNNKMDKKFFENASLFDFP